MNFRQFCIVSHLLSRLGVRGDGMVGETLQNAGTGDESGPFLSIHHAFAAVVAARGDKTALVHAGGTMSYRALDAAAERIADHLAAQAVGPGAFVGLWAEASPAAIIAILGILKAGAAYLPLDPSYPTRLIDFIRQDSAPALMLISRAERHRLQPLHGHLLVIEDLLDTPPPAAFGVAAPGAPDQLAYVMYTSGSTGRPKGVMVPHRAVLRLVLGADYADFGADQVFLQQAPLAFDAATFEIWGALLNGATLAIPAGGRASLDDIAEAIERFGVTTLWLTAGLFHLMVDHRLDSLRPLSQLLAGGDVLSAAHVRRLRQAIPGCRLINGYGPTENTTFSCCYTVPADLPAGSVPIGRPIHGTTAHVLDEAGRPVAAGESGELYLGGLGLAHGYLNQPKLTAERFVADPFDGRPGQRLYRTGDLVRVLSDGNLEFQGRVDRQVKINGKRIELDEIEAVSRQSALIRDAAAVVRETGGVKSIQLFVVADGTLDPAAFRRFLAEELPDYMIPARIVPLERLPLSPTGKLDRARLVEPEPSAAAITVVGESVHRVRAAWAQALGHENFGADDNFFDLGGTSLQLVGIHATLQTAFGRTLPLVELFAHPTVRSLARWLDGSTTAPTAAAVSDLAAKRNASLARARLARRVIPS